MTAKTAFIVDDDEFVSSLVRRQLLKLGFDRVDCAMNGADALHSLSIERPFDLVICDLSMPDFDGVMFLRELACRPSPPQVILVSGLDSSMLRAAGNLADERGLRVLGTLPKPVETGPLATLVERMGHDRRARRPRSALAAVTGEAIQSAISKGDFFVAAQPIVSVRKRELNRVEILPRWHHPSGGVLPAVRFGALAEKAGLSQMLVQHFLGLALAAQQSWDNQSLDFSLSMDLPVCLLGDPNLPEWASKVVANAGSNPTRIMFQIQESVWAPATASCLDTLIRLRFKGFGLSLHDFGVGESSFARLTAGPFSELMIDHSLVQVMSDDLDTCSVAEEHFRLAEDLNWRSLAQGVQDARQLERLGNMGCDLAQGVVIAEPMAPDNLAKWAGTFQRSNAGAHYGGKSPWTEKNERSLAAIS